MISITVAGKGNYGTAPIPKDWKKEKSVKESRAVDHRTPTHQGHVQVALGIFTNSTIFFTGLADVFTYWQTAVPQARLYTSATVIIKYCLLLSSFVNDCSLFESLARVSRCVKLTPFHSRSLLQFSFSSQSFPLCRTDAISQLVAAAVQLQQEQSEPKKQCEVLEKKTSIFRNSSSHVLRLVRYNESNFFQCIQS